MSYKEKIIYENKENITTTKNDARNKYYLDTNGVLHWYDDSGNYKFSLDKELILDSSVNMLDDNGNLTTDFITLFENKNILFAGQTILRATTDGKLLEYINLGETVGVVKVNLQTKDIGSTIIQFTRRAGGMIVNGDIYTWGNIANRIVGIDKNTYTTENGSYGNKYPVITGLVRARAKVYDVNSYIAVTNNSTNRRDCKSPIGSGTISCEYSSDNCNPPSGSGRLLCKDIGNYYSEQNYFSSANRPKFVDFFATVFHSTCGISIKGELYCGGLASAYQEGFLYTNLEPSNPGIEMLYKSKDFDGTANKKANKIFANDSFWLIFGNADKDNNGNYKNGKIYRWGGTNYGFGGNNNRSFSTSTMSELNIVDNEIKVLFKDLTYLLTLGHRKIAALSNQGEIYIWGVDKYNSDSLSCSSVVNNITYKLCVPTKISTSNSTMNSFIKFESIQGGLDAFVAKDENGKYYKVSHPLDEKIQVISINDSIRNYSSYDTEDDSEILSVDFSRKLSDTNLEEPSNGIVWVNGKNELKGDYFSSDNYDDKIFESAIKKIKWKKIKVIQDDNGMCGIDINNQMYCWGIMSYYGENMRDTFMLPVFNTNLYDADKDYLIAEGGDSNLTNMTSYTWETTNSSGKTGAFFMKYPTYIGGFNYEFTFK